MRKSFNIKSNKLLSIFGTIIIMLSNRVYAAEVVSEVSGGGAIQSSKLGQGLLNIVRDITGTLQWILPIVRSMFSIILYI